MDVLVAKKLRWGFFLFFFFFLSYAVYNSCILYSMNGMKLGRF